MIVGDASVIVPLLVRDDPIGVRVRERMRDFDALPIARHAHRALLPRVWALRDNLSPYDAAYVALAEALAAPLLTADAAIPSAPGLRCEVELFA